MKFNLERNNGANSVEVPYFIEVEIVLSTVDAGTTFKVPVRANYTGTSKSFAIEICGFRRWASNPQALLQDAYQLVSSLIKISRLPSYVFITRQEGEIYPVYTIGHEVFATTPGGPIFNHVELAKVREYLNDYLHDIGTLGENGVSDRLHVRGISPRTLGLRHPVLYLKKRVLGQTDFWAPVFESGDGQKIYTYAASDRREVQISDGKEVLELRELVAKALKHDKRLENQFDLRPDRLRSEYWQRLKATLESVGAIEVNGFFLDVFRLGSMLLAVELREDEEKCGIYVGSSIEDVTNRVRIDFDRRGVFVSSATAVAA